MASDDRAVNFALKQTVKHLDGLTTTIDGAFVDVKARLDSDPVITVTDPAEIEAFRLIDALKEVSAGEAAQIRKPGATVEKEEK